MVHGIIPTTPFLTQDGSNPQDNLPILGKGISLSQRVEHLIERVKGTLSLTSYAVKYISRVQFTDKIVSVLNFPYFLAIGSYAGGICSFLSFGLNLRLLSRQISILSDINKAIKEGAVFNLSKEEIKKSVSIKFFNEKIENSDSKVETLQFSGKDLEELKKEIQKVSFAYTLGLISSILGIATLIASFVACPVLPLALTVAAVLFFVCQYVYTWGVLNRENSQVAVSLFGCLPNFIQNYVEAISLYRSKDFTREESKKKFEKIFGKEVAMDSFKEEEIAALLRNKILVETLKNIAKILAIIALGIATTHFCGIEILLLVFASTAVGLMGVGHSIEKRPIKSSQT